MTKRILAVWHHAYGEYRNLTVIILATVAQHIAVATVQTSFLIKIMLASLIASSLFVVLAALRDAVRAVRNGLREGWELQLVGTVLFFAASGVLAGWGMLYRILDQPDWMTDNVFVAFARWYAVLGAWMVMFAPRDRDGKVPAGTWGWVVAYIAGLVTAVCLVSVLGYVP